MPLSQRINSYVAVPLLFLFMLALLPAVRVASASPVISENFDNNTFNPSNWHAVTLGTGPTVTVANDRLEVTIPSNSANDPSVAQFGAALTSNCVLQGDFDYQVGFQLVNWPVASGVRSGVGSSFLLGGLESTYSPTSFAVERGSLAYNDVVAPGSEDYLTHLSDGIQGITQTTDQQGVLRMNRVGGTATGFYQGGNGWVQIHSGPVTTSDVSFGFGAWSHDRFFAHVSTEIAFDNFTLNSGNLLCPTITPNPTSGPVGTMVTVQGSGFPMLQGVPVIGPSVEVTFDDQFIGTTTNNNGSFSFTFNVPVAQAGHHLIKALDLASETTATADFQVTSTSTGLSLSLTTGTIYFPGDTVVADMLVTSTGPLVTSSNLQITITMTKPDNTQVRLNVTIIGSGLFKTTYSLPKTASIGTYSLVASAHLSGTGDGSALATFEVRLPWLSSQAQTAMIGSGIATVALGGIALFSWRKGFLRKSKDFS